ncbi:hypothetical protein NBRC110019_09250 [Neptunitalea chrysea]|uniref:Hydrolase n=1 Tax=Neptunitalea chrysea TaxID=1647581 RepID=A0A9W6B3E8_9FLAO|nr:hydrolase [Neptunitalea chrysea]GLB51886.1 hypothetical protein NBRC110019_09250 [Neptunitalea chrysea]
MKKQIFQLLFIFAILLIIFQFVSASKAYKETSNVINELRIKNRKLKDETKKLSDSLKNNLIKFSDVAYFTLKNDNQALDYFKDSDIGDVSKYVTQKLLETNSIKENPLIPSSELIEGLKINKVNVINHKWIVCDFTNGEYWGQLFLEYTLKKDKTIFFVTISDVVIYK